MPIYLLLSLLLLSSCSLLNKKGSWGKNAFWPIKSRTVVDAFKKNITSPHVWVPLAGAGITFWGDYDEKITSWANEKRPIYGSEDNASNWSDDLNLALKSEMYLTTLLTPSMDKDGNFINYVFYKAKGLVVVDFSSRLSSQAQREIRDMAKRERPNNYDHRSFPSGHSTNAGSRRQLSNNNLNTIDMAPGLRTGINSVNMAMAGGVMWARLEANAHYPSDVLCGYALGTFVSGFIYDSLMGLDPDESFALIPANGEVVAIYSYRF